MALDDYIYSPPDIPQIFRDLVGSVSDIMSTELTELGYTNGIHYEHDTWNKLMDKLSTMNKSNVHKSLKYPLIALIHSFEQKVGMKSEMYDVSLDFIICNLTKPEWYGEQRRVNNYLTVLNPIYSQFIHMVGESKMFSGYKNTFYPHTKIDDYHMSESAEKYKLPDFLDAILIKGLQLSIKATNNNC